MVIPPDRPDRLDAQKSLAALSACFAMLVRDKVSRLMRVERLVGAMSALPPKADIGWRLSNVH
jgi:hypothetical protein